MVIGKMYELFLQSDYNLRLAAVWGKKKVLKITS